MIKPTIGRVVLVYRSDEQSQPFPALVTAVHSDTMINVAGFETSGTPFAENSIELHQDDWPGTGRRAEWMPYQKAVAQRPNPAQS